MPRIAICAPSTPITHEDAERVAALAEEFPALDLQFHAQCFESRGHFAGADTYRMLTLVECAKSEGVDAVWFARGGYGATRIAEATVRMLRHHPPEVAFLGYSDAGYLLSALYRAGIGKQVHAPMPVDIRREGGEEAVRRTLAFLAGDRSGLEPSLDERPTVAFNLMTLSMLCGTELLPDLTGHVVMVEEVSEYHYAIDRLFFHVTHCLKGIAGLRLGRVSDIPENDRPFGHEVEEIARYWCDHAEIPFLGSADIGHDPANKIVPFGLASQGAAS